MSAFTPGPWRVSDGGASNYTASVQADSARGKAFNVAMLAKPMRGDVEANVRLIAESPSLHAIAESVLTALHYPRGSEAQVRAFEEIGQDAQAALARVAGAAP